MIHIHSFRDVYPGQILIAHEDIYKSVGGHIYCLTGTRLIVTKVFDQALTACPEGGTGKEVGHTFVGTRSLNQVRLLEFAIVAKDSRKDDTLRNKNKPNRKIQYGN